MDQLVWVAVIGGAIVLFWLPVIIAAIRGTQPLGIVILLTLLTPLGGVTWFGAWLAVFMFPRSRPARTRGPGRTGTTRGTCTAACHPRIRRLPAGIRTAPEHERRSGHDAVDRLQPGTS